MPRFTIYQALCERLETLDLIIDATECFLDMTYNLPQETNSEQAQWITCEKLCGSTGNIYLNVLCQTSNLDVAPS